MGADLLKLWLQKQQGTPEWRRSHGQRVKKGKAREKRPTHAEWAQANLPSPHTLHHPMSHFSNVGFLSFEKEQKKSYISCTQLLTKANKLFGPPATSTEMALNKLSGLLEQPLSP